MTILGFLASGLPGGDGTRGVNITTAAQEGGRGMPRIVNPCVSHASGFEQCLPLVPVPSSAVTMGLHAMGP